MVGVLCTRGRRNTRPDPDLSGVSGRACKECRRVVRRTGLGDSDQWGRLLRGKLEGLRSEGMVGETDRQAVFEGALSEGL